MVTFVMAPLNFPVIVFVSYVLRMVKDAHCYILYNCYTFSDNLFYILFYHVGKRLLIRANLALLVTTAMRCTVTFGICNKYDVGAI